MRVTILFNENRFIISGLAWVIEAKAFGNGDLGHCGWCLTGLVRVFSRQGSWLLWVLLFSSVMLKSSEKWRDKQLFTLTKISFSCRMMAPWGLPLCVVVQCLECQSAIRVIPALTPPPPASVCWRTSIIFSTLRALAPSMKWEYQYLLTVLWGLNENKDTQCLGVGLHKRCWFFLLSEFC